MEQGVGIASVGQVDFDWGRRHAVVQAVADADMVAREKIATSKKKAKEKHSRCRFFGVPFCGGALEEKLRKKISEAVRTLCQADSKKINGKDGREKLLGGHWCFHFSGKAKQRRIEEFLSSESLGLDIDDLGPDTEDPGIGSSNEKQGEHRMQYWMHVSFVWGGLKQFNPVFGRIEPVELSTADHDWPSKIDAKSTGAFLDYFQLLQLLLQNEEMEWSLQVYELVWSTAAIPALVPSLIQLAHRSDLRQCVVWKGASEEKKIKAPNRRGPGRPGPRPPKRSSHKRKKSMTMKDIDSAVDLFAPSNANHIEARDGNQPPPAAALADLLDMHMDDRTIIGNDDGDDCNEPFAFNSNSGSSSDESGASHTAEASNDPELAPNADGDASMWDYVNKLLSIDPSEGQGPKPEVALVEPDRVDPAEAPGPSIVARDGGNSASVEPPVAREAAAKPRAAAAVPEIRERHDSLLARGSDGQVKGVIKHKPTSNDMFIKCNFHAECTKTRTLNPSTSHKRRAQGRVLGFLSAWCLEGGQFDSKAEHFKHIPSLESRQRARARLHEEVNSGLFFDLERAKLEGEESEPEKCP